MGIKSGGKAGLAEEEEGGNDFDGEEEVGREGEDDDGGGAGSVSGVYYVWYGAGKGRDGLYSTILGKMEGGKEFGREAEFEESSNFKGVRLRVWWRSFLFGLGSALEGETGVVGWLCGRRAVYYNTLPPILRGRGR